MRYLSTRGRVGGLSFEDAVLMGLADDGGLLLPESIPIIPEKTLHEWAQLSYSDLAFKILSLYADDIPQETLRALITRAYAGFDHPEITPVVRRDDLYILELFHGPTLAFKDLALQFLGNLFEYLTEKNGSRMNILGATSGDTGSAAICGVRGRKNINIFILHPNGRVSPVQRMQMTTVPDANVFNVAVEGTFDTCQSIVKELFEDLEFKERFSLASINSINWARLAAQIVYYFYAWGRVWKATGREDATFAVPTGNFGDVFAGLLARRMGLPVRPLIIATNENNILTRFVCSGDYSTGQVVETIAPSMDIQVASNFERYLYLLYGQDAQKTRSAMETFKKTHTLSFSAEEQRLVAKDFSSHSVSQPEITATIRDFHQKTGYLLDPHTAVGVAAGLKLRNDDSPLICLSTAHPAKFARAVHNAVGFDPPRPAQLAGIEDRPERYTVMQADSQAVKALMMEKLQSL